MTNQLFREVLDGRIPMPRRRAKEGVVYVVLRPKVNGFVEALEMAAEAVRFTTDQIRKPTPTPAWAGNIATQKRPKGNRYK